MNITNNELSFQASINASNFTKSKQFENIDRVFKKLTDNDSRGHLIIEKTFNNKIKFTTNKTSVNNIMIKLDVFRNDLNTLSDIELADKFAKYYRIIKNANSILDLESRIAELHDKLSEAIRKKLNGPKKYGKLENSYNETLSLLKDKLSQKTKNFYEEKEQSSKLYPEIKQMDLQ